MYALASTTARQTPSRSRGTSRSASTPRRPSIAAITNKPASSCCNWRHEVPNLGRGQAAIGDGLAARGPPPEAESCYPRRPPARPRLCRGLDRPGTGRGAARRRSSPALKHIETAIEIDPHRSRGPTSPWAGCSKHREEPTRRSRSTSGPSELEPNNAEISLSIATIQLSRNQPDQALSRLDQVVELAPENGEARDLRGRAHLALRHFAQAIEDFRAAANRLPNRADIYYNLALALEADHKPADALRAAEQALRLAPDFADARRLSQRLALAVMPAGKPRHRPKVSDAEAPPSRQVAMSAALRN